MPPSPTGPREQEIAGLATVAGRGVHHPDARPFLTPWTTGGDEVVVSDRLRLTRQKWQSQPRADATAAGLAGCRLLFGL